MITQPKKAARAVLAGKRPSHASPAPPVQHAPSGDPSPLSATSPPLIERRIPGRPMRMRRRAARTWPDATPGSAPALPPSRRVRSACAVCTGRPRCRERTRPVDCGGGGGRKGQGGVSGGSAGKGLLKREIVFARRRVMHSQRAHREELRGKDEGRPLKRVRGAEALCRRCSVGAP